MTKLPSQLLANARAARVSIYRLLVDENGQEDCRDFTKYADAYAAWQKARRKRTTFSATINQYDLTTHEHVAELQRFERN